MLFSYSGDCSSSCRRSFSQGKLGLELVVVHGCGPRRARAEVCLNNLSKSQVDISKSQDKLKKIYSVSQLVRTGVSNEDWR